MMRFRESIFLLLTIALLSIGSYCSAQVNSLPIIKVDSSMQVIAKPVLILLSTDWCKYCQMQKVQLRKNKRFQEKVKQIYYVEFNAEDKEEISFNGQSYHYKATGVETGIHELAVALNGKEGLSFPTWVLLDCKYQVLFRYSGVMSEKQLNEILEYLDRND